MAIKQSNCLKKNNSLYPVDVFFFDSYNRCVILCKNNCHHTHPDKVPLYDFWQGKMSDIKRQYHPEPLVEVVPFIVRHVLNKQQSQRYSAHCRIHTFPSTYTCNLTCFYNLIVFNHFIIQTMLLYIYCIKWVAYVTQMMSWWCFKLDLNCKCFMKRKLERVYLTFTIELLIDFFITY